MKKNAKKGAKSPLDKALAERDAAMRALECILEFVYEDPPTCSTPTAYLDAFAVGIRQAHVDFRQEVDAAETHARRMEEQRDMLMEMLVEARRLLIEYGEGEKR